MLPIDEKIQTIWQRAADIFNKTKVIPKLMQVKAAFLPPEEYAKLFQVRNSTLF